MNTSPSPKRWPDPALDAARFPLLRFRSTRVEPLDATRARVHGRLTIRDVTRDVTLEAAYEGQAVGPGGVLRARFRATTAIGRRAFGVHWNPLGGLLVGDRVEITLRVAAVRRG